MTSNVVAIRAADQAGAEALAALAAHLGRCALSTNTVSAYQRQATAYIAWLDAHPGAHPDAFVDEIGAEAAVTAYRRKLLGPDRSSPSTVNQALAAITLLYEHGARMRIKAKRARVAKPGEPVALTRNQEGALRRAAERRGVRDGAIIAVLLDSGARVAECARLAIHDVPITPRTGHARLFGKGDQVRTVPLPSRARERVSAWLLARADLLEAKPELAGRVGDGLWVGQRGRLSIDGITEVVLAAGAAAGITGLRPHRLRDTYATRLREGGADPAQIQRLMGHASIETTARYFRAGAAEVAELVERVLGA